MQQKGKEGSGDGLGGGGMGGEQRYEQGGASGEGVATLSVDVTMASLVRCGQSDHKHRDRGRSIIRWSTLPVSAGTRVPQSGALISSCLIVRWIHFDVERPVVPFFCAKHRAIYIGLTGSKPSYLIHCAVHDELESTHVVKGHDCTANICISTFLNIASPEC